MNNNFENAQLASCFDAPTIWSEGKDTIMAKACREFAQFHYDNNNLVKQLYDRENFSPSSIKNIDDLEKIPTIGVVAMKHNLLTTLPHDQVVLNLTSSGTKGQKTQIWFDQASLDRVQNMMDSYLNYIGFSSNKPTNYLIFTYDPEDAKDLGIAYSDKNLLRFAPVKKVYYCIRKNKAGDWHFDKKKTLSLLKEYEKDSYDLRILGMPGFIYEFLTSLEKEKTFNFSPNSWIITGGGWKAAEDKAISRADFRHMCSNVFKIPLENIRDGYGMAEHCAPYFECAKHRFHVPAFCRLIIRDPETLKPLPKGEKGLLELITPFNAMMPTLALLSTDWAKIHSGPCPCGDNSDTFEILGRAGISKHKGCALHADEIIKRGRS